MIDQSLNMLSIGHNTRRTYGKQETCQFSYQQDRDASNLVLIVHIYEKRLVMRFILKVSSNTKGHRIEQVKKKHTLE